MVALSSPDWQTFTNASVDILEVQNGVMKNFNYLIFDNSSKQAVVVDPAWEIQKIEDSLTIHGSGLSGVLLTHSHSDHIDLADEVSRKFHCPIWMSKAEVAFSGYRSPNLVAIDESEWYFGATKIRAIWTPGHTPGGLCFHIRDALFTGDTLFAEGCGMCFSSDDAEQMYLSLQRLTELPDHVRVFPGHSYGRYPGQKLNQIKQDNLYLQFGTSDEFVAYRMRSGQTRKKMFGFK